MHLKTKNMLKTFIIAVLFLLTTLPVIAQSGDSTKSAREALIEQENKRRSHPDLIRNKTVIKAETKDDTTQQSVTGKKKQKRCWFRRKKNETD